MIRYGDIEMDFERNSLQVIKGNNVVVREYPGRDISDYFDLGKSPTRINVILLAKNDKVIIESLLHTIVPRELHLVSRGEYYKKVIPDVDFEVNSIGTTKSGYYRIPARFICLDPIPYDIETREVLY